MTFILISTAVRTSDLGTQFLSLGCTLFSYSPFCHTMNTEGSGHSISSSSCQKTRGRDRCSIQAGVAKYFWWRTERSYFKLSADKTAAWEKIRLCEGKLFYLKNVEISSFWSLLRLEAQWKNEGIFPFILNFGQFHAAGALYSVQELPRYPLNRRVVAA